VQRQPDSGSKLLGHTRIEEDRPAAGPGNRCAFSDFRASGDRGRGSRQHQRGKLGLEARSLFESEVDYLEIFDSEHSDFEDRFIAIGPIERGLVVIVYTEREEDIIRIIGARWANNREQSLYRSYVDQNR